MAEVYEYIVATGTIIPDTSSILGDTQVEYQAVLGADLVVTPDTPQGVLIVGETASRADVVKNNAALANQINPNINGGVYQDSVAALLGLQRKAAQKSIIPAVVLSGVAGTTVPAGTQAQSTAGDVFESLTAAVIGIGGTVAVDFVSLVSGPVNCPINALTQVLTNITGWETVTNPNAAVVGATTQSDQSFRAYRNNTLGIQGVALPVAITSALYAVEGVTSLTFRENVAATTQVIDGISLVAHSVWACVRGGSDLDIAAALLENKSNGSNWNGATTVNVVEPSSGQTYQVKFQRPTEVPILIKVTTPNGDAANIKQAVLDYVGGNLDGFEGWKVGSDALTFEIAGGITSVYPSTLITKVEITLASSPGTFSTNNIVIDLDEIATTELSYITVVNA